MEQFISLSTERWLVSTEKVRKIEDLNEVKQKILGWQEKDTSLFITQKRERIMLFWTYETK